MLTSLQTNIKTGHFLKGEIGAFDAPFFSIQPAEAMSLDPQQRIMLEVSYRALENGKPHTYSFCRRSLDV